MIHHWGDPTENEISEHEVYSNLERLLDAGCVHVCAEIYEWLHEELKKRKAAA